jgi:hypothetical protein
MFVTGTVAPVRHRESDYVAQLRVAPDALSGMLHVDNQAPDAVGNEVMQGMVSYRFANALAGQLSAAVAICGRRRQTQICIGRGTTQTRRRRPRVRDGLASESKSRLSSIPDDPNDYERSRFTAGCARRCIAA